MCAVTFGDLRQSQGASHECPVHCDFSQRRGEGVDGWDCESVQSHAVSRPQDLANRSPMGVFTRSQGLGSDQVWGMFEDAAGDIWVGGNGFPQTTLSRWERRKSRLHRYSVEDGLPADDRLTGIAQDSEMSLWFAFREGGLVRYRDGRFKLFGQPHGLQSSKIAGIPRQSPREISPRLPEV